MFNCIIFLQLNLQFPSFPNKFEILVKSKMAATLAAILDDVTDPGNTITHNMYLFL